MHEAITYRTNTATAEEIHAHLVACDAAFIPPLSTRVNLLEYAQKLIAKAQRLEAWAGNTLVGLAAFYDNEPPHAFLTNLSVLPQWQRQNIAATLLEDCCKQSLGAGFTSLRLEVASGNNAAIALYRKQGFEISTQNDTHITMQRML